MVRVFWCAVWMRVEINARSPSYVLASPSSSSFSCSPLLSLRHGGRCLSVSSYSTDAPLMFTIPYSYFPSCVKKRRCDEQPQVVILCACEDADGFGLKCVFVFWFYSLEAGHYIHHYSICYNNLEHGDRTVIFLPEALFTRMFCCSVPLLFLESL